VKRKNNPYLDKAFFIPRESILRFFFVFLLSIISFLLVRFSIAAQVSLTWEPSSSPDVAGYKIYYGTASRTYTNSITIGNITSYTITDLTEKQTYYITITAYDFSNNESSYSNEVSFSSHTKPFPFFDNFNTDKGWIGYEYEGWTREHTYSEQDNYFLGISIGQDYSNNLTEKTIISPPINCALESQVFLKFWRYLNVQNNFSQHAKIFVSNDGLNWTQLWENPVFNITDNQWRQVIFDISSVAAKKETVYIKFTIGSNYSSSQFSQWNIDNLEVTSAYNGPLALYVHSGILPNPNINELLIENGFGIKQAKEIPSDLSRYKLLLIAKNDVYNPITAKYIKNFISSGGGAVIIGSTPKFLAGNTNDLSSIKDWFGAASYGNDCGFATITLDEIFGIHLMPDEKVIDYKSKDNCSGPSVYNLDLGSNYISNWSNFRRIFSFKHNFEKGRIFYFAGNPGYTTYPDIRLIENGISLFEAGLLWAAASPWDEDIDGSDLAIFASEFGRTDCGIKYPCQWDLDRDGDVDELDLATFAVDFGKTICVSGLTCQKDLYIDGDLDGSDLATFAQEFGRKDCKSIYPCQGDFDGDGDVDKDDLAIFVKEFGKIY